MAENRVVEARELIDGVSGDERIIDGVNTGFGALGRIRIREDEANELQYNLIASHASGTGDPLPDEVVRAMMLLLCNSLAKGVGFANSGGLVFVDESAE